MESPELTLLRVYQLLASSGHSLAEFIAPYRILHKSDEISIPVNDQKRVAGILKAVAQEFPKGAHSALDGLTIEYPDWWLNIRASHTEAAVRLVVEAKKKDLLDRVVKEVMAIAHS
jgi:phosphomannomutase